MSKNSATVIKDGQLAVATVPQTGTLVGAASEIDATALVETADGLQLCVKTCDLNGGGGGGGTVDQTYDPTSTNAQSGTAVAEAVEPALKNIATGTGSLQISSTSTTAISRTYVTAIGNVIATGISGIGISSGNSNCTVSNSSIAIGNAGATGAGAIAISGSSYAGCSGANAIQLGGGSNKNANTLQVYEYPLLDGTTGKIPMARLPIVQCTQAEYDALVSGGTVDANTIYCIIPA